MWTHGFISPECMPRREVAAWVERNFPLFGGNTELFCAATVPFYVPTGRVRRGGFHRYPLSDGEISLVFLDP